MNSSTGTTSTGTTSTGTTSTGTTSTGTTSTGSTSVATTSTHGAARGTGPADLPVAARAAVLAMMRTERIPGLSVAVVDAGGVRCAAGFGTADLATGMPATTATAYLWFSMTKIVTATAAMRLADEGRLDLDAPVAAAVPELRAPGGRPPTVRQLLQHTAGLANPVPIRWVHPADADPPDPQALLHRLLRRRRAYRYPVGGAAHYTNLGYLALGAVVQVAAGMPFQRYVREAVLDPLGMARTGFGYAPGAEVAGGYVRAPRILDPLLRAALPRGVVGSRHGAYLGLARFLVDGPAFGGLVGDVLDAGRFLRMHLRDGELDGRRILADGTARAMRVVDRPGRPFDHGLGWFRRPTPGGATWVEHFGAGAGFWNVMRLYPQEGVGIVMMANTTAAYDFEPVFALLARGGS